MDKGKAKILLRSFRPDGADAGSEEFFEALQLATVDRELGEWFARERAEDAKFAKALSNLEIPDELRSDIMAVLEYDGSPVDDSDDLQALFVGAMGTISVPHGLRDEIMAAMELESKVVDLQSQQAAETGIWRKLSIVAMAAVAAVLVFLNVKPDEQEVNPEQLAVSEVTHQLMNSLHNNPNIKMAATNVSTDEGIEWLRGEELPVPKRVPSGLEDAKFLGCKVVHLSCGEPASLLCFEKPNLGVIYLIVLNIDELKDAECLLHVKQLGLRSCASCPVTKFHVVRWREDDKAYFLLTKAKQDDVLGLF